MSTSTTSQLISNSAPSQVARVAPQAGSIIAIHPTPQKSFSHGKPLKYLNEGDQSISSTFNMTFQRAFKMTFHHYVCNNAFHLPYLLNLPSVIYTIFHKISHLSSCLTLNINKSFFSVAIVTLETALFIF